MNVDVIGSPSMNGIKYRPNIYPKTVELWSRSLKMSELTRVRDEVGVLADLMDFFNCRGTPKRKLSLSSIDTPPACGTGTQEQGRSSESGKVICCEMNDDFTNSTTFFLTCNVFLRGVVMCWFDSLLLCSN
jgi:hypothetical protein